MALQFVQVANPAKGKAKKVTEVSQTVTPLQEAVDEYVKISQTLEQLEVAKMQKRLEELKKELLPYTADVPMDDAVTLKGTVGSVLISAARTETVVVDKSKMVNALGDALFLDLAKVGITDLNKYLSATEVATFTEKKYGSRSFKGFVVTE